MRTPSTHATLYFGPFVLGRGERVLRLGDKRFALPAGSAEMLWRLASAAGATLTDEALAPGGGTAHVAARLRADVARLNQVLAHGSHSHYVAELPGAGYRFFGEVSFTAPSDPPSAAHVHHEIPALRQRLIGRHSIVASLAARAMRERLLTITGAGGMGKTSLALAVARRCQDDRAGFGACFVDLSALTMPEQIVGAVASAMGVALSNDDPRSTLLAALQHQELLIVLDNCEHLIQGSAEVAEWLLLQSPGVHVIATSREPLRARGEQVHQLAPLRVPPEGLALSWEEARSYSAVELFELCAERSGVVLARGGDAEAACRICRHLEGVPLAIELAAAQLPVVGIALLLEQLGAMHLAMSQAGGDVPQRQRTLHATMEWSYSLLSAGEQAALQRLSLFRGEFPLDSALGLVRDTAEGDEDAALDALLGLAAKCLVAVEPAAGGGRYRLLETTRAYALGKLLQDPGHDAARERHVMDSRRRLRLAEDDWSRMPSRQWLALHGRLIEELRFGLDWALQAAHAQRLGVELLLDALPLAARMALVYEFLARIKDALGRLRAADTGDRMTEFQLCAAMGGWMMNMARTDDAMREFNAQVQAMIVGLTGERSAAAAWMALWMSSVSSADYPGALYAAQQQMAWAEAEGDEADVIDAQRQCAYSWHFSGDHAKADALARTVLSRARPNMRVAYYNVNQVDSRVSMRIVLSRVQWVTGRAEQALDTIGLGLRFAEGDRPTAKGLALAFAACPIALWRGDDALAAEWVTLLDRHAVAHGLPLFQDWAAHYAGVLASRGHALSVSRTAEALGAPSTMQSDMLATLGDAQCVRAAIPRARRELIGWCAPEMLRQEGELALRDGGSRAAALKSLAQARALAQQQGALAWELRVATSLARVHQREGDAQRGVEVLAPVFMRVDEGRDTADVRDARGLLEALRQGTAA